MTTLNIDLALAGGSALPAGLTLVSGAYTFDGSGLVPTGNTFFDVVGTAADFDFTVEVQRINADSSYTVVYFRQVDLANTWVLLIRNVDRKLILRKDIAGVATTVKDTSPTELSYPTTEVVTYRISAIGNVILVYVNGAVIISTVDDYNATATAIQVRTTAGAYRWPSASYTDEGLAVNPATPFTLPIYQEGFKRQVTNRLKLADRPSTMPVGTNEYWPRVYSTADITNWPVAKYPLIMITSTDHDNGFGGIYVRVYAPLLGTVNNPAAWLEWDDVSNQSEFSHITRKTNPIWYDASSVSTETPTFVFAGGNVLLYYHVADFSTPNSGGAVQATKYAISSNGIDFASPTASTIIYNRAYKTGNGHTGYLSQGVNTFNQWNYSTIGLALHGGADEEENSGQQIIGTNDGINWDRLATWRRPNRDLITYNNAGEFDYAYPLESVSDALKQGAYYRITGKYRPRQSGTVATNTATVEFLVDKNFHAVSAPNLDYLGLGAVGDFDNNLVSSVSEFVYDGQRYVTYNSLTDTDLSVIGIGTVEEVAHTWEIFLPYSSEQRLSSIESDGIVPATGITYSQAATAKIEDSENLTDLVVPITGSTVAKLNTPINLLADDMTLISFKKIGKNSTNFIRLDFGIRAISDPTKKIFIRFPEQASEASRKSKIQLVRAGTSSDGITDVEQYVGYAADWFSATGDESPFTKHDLSLRFIPYLNKVAVMSGASTISSINVFDIDYLADYEVFIEAQYTSTTQTEPDLVSFSNIYVDTFSADAATVSDTTKPVITVSGNAITTIQVDGTLPTFTATAFDDTDGDITANIVVSGDTPNASIAGTYVIRYNVTDAALNAANEVTRAIVVEAANNSTPTANAGINQNNVTGGALVQLDGSASSDSDGTIVAYQWVQVAGTSVALSNNTIVNPTFTAPNLISSETLIFGLTVTDNDGAVSAQDLVNIGILLSQTPNTAPTTPTITRTKTGTLAAGETDTLTASSTDAESDPITYSWTTSAGTLSASTGSSVTFTGPSGSSPVTATISCTSSDGSLTSAAGTINIDVAATIDTTPPVITVSGSPTTTVAYGGVLPTFTASALDDRDGIVAVMASGDTPNNTVAGTYIRRFNAEDSAGNQAVEVTRTIIVEAEVIQPLPPTLVVTDNSQSKGGNFFEKPLPVGKVGNYVLATSLDWLGSEVITFAECTSPTLTINSISYVENYIQVLVTGTAPTGLHKLHFSWNTYTRSDCFTTIVEVVDC